MTLSGNSLRQTVHTQAVKLVAALLRVAGITACLAESNGSLPLGLWLTSPAGWLPRTRISSRTLCSVIEYGLAFYSKLNKARDGGLILDQRWQGTDNRRENSSTYRSDRARFRECELACEQVRMQPTTRHQHSPPEHHCHSLIRWRTSLSLTHHCNKHNCIAALLLPSVLWRCWLGGNNHNESLKRWHCLPSHRLIVNMMLSNITFLMIFAVFGPSPLTLCLNCTRAHTRTHARTHARTRTRTHV